jgi:two-component system LytT family sensor kinase
MISALPNWLTTDTSQRSTSGSELLALVLSNRFACHTIFWISLFLFNAAYISFIGEDRMVSFYNLVLRIPFVLLCCYVNLYYLMPRFYGSGQLFTYIILLVLTIFGLNAVNLVLLNTFVETPICPSTFEADATFNASNYVYKSFYLFSVVALTSGIKLSKQELRERQRAEVIKREKLETELSLLKSQINPHFFFNTLNSLYALTLKKSDQAPDLVLRLSDLMSYNLYESEDAAVDLSNEIQHIVNYIELERVRIGNRGVLDFSVRGDVDNRKLPPLLFLPIIENCFKHSYLGTKGARISITIEVEGNSICFNHSESSGAPWSE